VELPEVEVSTAPPDASLAVNRLLAEAEAALKLDFLMTPIERNAFQYYRSVLILDSANVAAIGGLNVIRKRYYELAISAKQHGRMARVKSYLGRISTINNVLGSIDETLELDTLFEQEDTTITEERRNSGVALTVHSEDELLSSDIRNQFNPALVSKLIAKVLAGKMLTLSVQALADQYAQQINTAELIKLDESIASEYSAEKAYIAAQRAIISDDLLEAKTLLASFQFSSAQAEANRIRLLSGVCQKTNDFACAVGGYQKLAQSEYGQLNDWLGLAVSMDSIGRVPEAIQAYQHVVSSFHPDGRVISYARQRILDLSSYSYRR
jgi:hypothetical protein